MMSHALAWEPEIRARSSAAAGPRRRPRLQGPAWVIPPLSVEGLTPTIAASLCPPPRLGSFSAASGWSIRTGGPSVVGTAYFSGGSFIVDTDAALHKPFTATASNTISLVTGHTYEFSYSWTAYVDNPLVMTTALVIHGEVVPGSMAEASARSTRGTVRASYTAATSKPTVIAVRTVVLGSPSTRVGNYVMTSPISVRCTA